MSGQGWGREGLDRREREEADPSSPRDGYYRGRYAFYWNAFLFDISVA